ncbi:C25 family cysteine peptidase [Nitrospira sp. Nam80]
MSKFIVIRPKDDAIAQQASVWCDDLVQKFSKNRHTKVNDVDDGAPPDTGNIVLALQAGADLICYFGHGDENSWLTNFKATIDNTNIRNANQKAVVSVACKTACVLGPTAITAGIVSWLGFTIKVPVMTPHKNRDPIGEAIVDGLALLGNHLTMQEARDRIADNCDKLIVEFDTGTLRNHPGNLIGYYAAMSVRDHVVVHGNTRWALP